MENERPVTNHADLIPLYRAPLIVPPHLEPVEYSAPSTHRKEMLYEYLSDIGEVDRYCEVVGECDKPMRKDLPRSEYTDEQKRWIKVIRDQQLDLAPYPHEEYGGRELHHIWATGFLSAYLGLAAHPELISHPHNGITLSRNSHRGPFIPGRNESRHPEVDTAIRSLKTIPDALKHVFEDHRKLAVQGIRYWVWSDDKDMIRIATERTQKMRDKAAKRKENQ